MKYYHATDINNLKSIFEKGLNKGFDGCVYLTKKPEEAFRFVALRFYDEVAIIEVDIPITNKRKLEESFDHSYSFFGCRAYAYFDNISADKCDLYSIYTRTENGYSFARA